MRLSHVMTMVVSLVPVLSARADVSLPALFSDHMVLQQGAEVRVWGKAGEGEMVSVRFQGQEVSTVARGGHWEVKLRSLKAGGPSELVVTGKNTITLSDVLVGEVWVCSGQSNMEWPVRQSAKPDEEIANAAHARLRLFQAKKVVADSPQRETEGQWKVCAPETIPSFSAVGYYFGREVSTARDVPVGLIQAAWGGTPAEAWTPREDMEGDPDQAGYVKDWDRNVAAWPEAKERHEKEMAAWKDAAEKAKAENQPAPPQPKAPVGPDHPHRASGLYNGMIAPLTPFAIRGAIWYQGESNAGRAYRYRELFPMMIRAWRRQWGMGDFPFLFVQLANWRERKTEPGESDWAELREAQSLTLATPKTGQAVIIDIGDAKDIHPKNKQEVGRRLALAARSVAYGETLVHSGPVYEGMTAEAGAVRIRFRHVGGGLATSDGGPVKGVAVAATQGKWMWAQATIDRAKNELVVVCPDLPNPTAVRYAWADNPECNLINKEGLPASPFRTDSWPGVTDGK